MREYLNHPLSLKGLRETGRRSGRPFRAAPIWLRMVTQGGAALALGYRPGRTFGAARSDRAEDDAKTADRQVRVPLL